MEQQRGTGVQGRKSQKSQSQLTREVLIKAWGQLSRSESTELPFSLPIYSPAQTWLTHAGVPS